MKKLILMFLALLLLAGGTGLAEGAPADEFSVLSFSPSGTVKGRAPVKIMFSQPAAPKNLVGKALPADRHPVAFSPSIRGEGKWADAKTFVFTPLANLPSATLFRATLRDDLRDTAGRRLVGRQTWEFSTESLKLLRVQQVDFTENGNAVLELAFNLPVSPFRLRGYLVLPTTKNQAVGVLFLRQRPVLPHTGFHPSLQRAETPGDPGRRNDQRRRAPGNTEGSTAGSDGHQEDGNTGSIRFQQLP